MSAERQPSPSPSRRLSLSSKISALGAKLSRTLAPSSNADNYSPTASTIDPEETDSVSPIIPRPQPERSQSRGREPFHSTGRGGLGNIRQTSVSRDARSNPTGLGPDDFSVTRGREPIPHQQDNQVYSTGRGGAGNIRSPSRDPTPRVEQGGVDPAEQEVIREYAAAHEGAVHSSGRGGLGNMNRSRSRDPSAPPNQFYSTGRGGAGNIVHGEGTQHTAETSEEEERIKMHHAHSGLHSTGRGGAANITSTPEPAVEHPAHGHSTPHEFESTGRGGLGNMVRDRSSSRHRT